MRINPELTIDRSGEKASRSEVFARVYFVDEMWRITRGRPWHHLRYHSSSPTEKGLFQTLHLLTVERDPETEYFLPHEGHSSEDGFPKIFAFCLEHSTSRLHPQNVDEVKEIRQAKRSISKRRASVDDWKSWQRRDYLTDEPLGVYFYKVGLDTFAVMELHDIEFREIPVLETKTELNYRRWATTKANRAAVTAD